MTQIPPVPELPAYAGSPGANGLKIYDSIPAAWTYTPQVETVAPADDQWWSVFGDERLVNLIRQATENSLNLRMTLHRIEMARNAWKAAQAGWYPTLGLTAGWTKERTSGDMTGLGRTSNMSYFNLGLNFNWEIDVFGRIAAQVKEGKASYNASRAEYDAAMISLSSNIATAYTNLLLAQAQIQLAEQQINTQKKSMKSPRRVMHAAWRPNSTSPSRCRCSTPHRLPCLCSSSRRPPRSIPWPCLPDVTPINWNIWWISPERCPIPSS